MSYLTLTYDYKNEFKLLSYLQNLRAKYLEIDSKKCVSMIPGLKSCSFQFENEEIRRQVQEELHKLPTWINSGLKTVEEKELKWNRNGSLECISFGFLKSSTEYCRNQIIHERHQLKWETNIFRNYIDIKYKNYELRINKENIDKYFLKQIKYYEIILPLKTPPRCYVLSQHRRQYPVRTLNFGKIDQFCLALNSSICLQFSDQFSFKNFQEVLNKMMKLECYETLIQTIEVNDSEIRSEFILANFWSNYALQTLLSVGYRIQYQMKRNVVHKINQIANIFENDTYPAHRCYSKLIACYYHARQNRFFNLNENFDKIEPLSPNIILNTWSYVPRVYLTPCGLYPLPIKPMRGNRILREQDQFGPGENFCRVIIRDIDLTPPQIDFIKCVEQWLKDLFMGEKSISFGQQSYKFLLFSNSQLRDRSFWFYANYGNNNADDIRKWMGDFSQEKCIGTYVARMALSLTGTTATIQLLPEEMQLIEDKFDANGRNFTDGVGKISSKALKQALTIYNPEVIDENDMPSSIQARLNGIKGIFVRAPDLDNTNIQIQYRQSQHKFTTHHNVLEIVKPSSSGMLFLNRQVIVLLESMNVPETTFLKLQNKTRLRISMSLLANKAAKQTLENHVRCYDWERMHNSGIQLIKEPFVRSLLLLLAKERLKRLKERSHVSIPLSDGRMLMGVIDETNSLKYGEIFIQLRDLDGKSQVLNKTVLITKNPAHFPGDIRKLKAVDRPALHHLYECVVFPAEGQRPHSNEISGSDLDGDEYWVCWNDELVERATIQHHPAEFDSAGKTKHNGEITMKEVSEFLLEYLMSDSLGVLSNRHLACCALYGPDHEYSRQLAQIISQAVDFPKTGVLPKIPENIKIDKYPDYMENKNKESFISDSSIGKMYREIKEVWTIHSDYLEHLNEKPIDVDKNFLVAGYKKYVDDGKAKYEYYRSRMNTILSIYNLENEYELITGCHSCQEEERKNNDSVQTALLEFRCLITEMRKIFLDVNMSHEQQLQKASAWYYVAYNSGTLLSFAWIMNRLMSEIIKQQHIHHAEHQALTIIGKSIQNNNLEAVIRHLIVVRNIGNSELENAFTTENLGHQFLELINSYNESLNDQNIAHRLLNFLHNIALNVS